MPVQDAVVTIRSLAEMAMQRVGPEGGLRFGPLAAGDYTLSIDSAALGKADLPGEASGGRLRGGKSGVPVGVHQTAASE